MPDAMFPRRIMTIAAMAMVASACAAKVKVISAGAVRGVAVA